MVDLEVVGSKPCQTRKGSLDIFATLVLPGKLGYRRDTLTMYCGWKDPVTMERTDPLPLYAEAMKMQLLTS